MKTSSCILSATRASILAALLGACVAGAQTPSPSRPGSGEVIELSPFTVSEAEGTGYLYSTSTVGTRTNRATIEVPQSIHMVTSKMLEDLAAFKEEDAIRYLPNVFARNTYGAPGQHLIRGFEREGSTYLDGFAVPGYRRDSAAYERMELIKGPPSAVQGRSGGSGAINWVGKKPVHGARFFRTGVMYATDGNYEQLVRTTFDVNRTVRDGGKGKRLSVRAAGVFQYGNSVIEWLPENLQGLYPSVRWDITPNTELTFFGEFLKSREPGTNIGLGPSFLAKDYRDKFNNPVLGGSPNDPISQLDIPFGANPYGPAHLHRETIASGTLSLTHRFNEHINVRQGYQRFAESDRRRNGEPSSSTAQLTTAHLGVPGVWVANSIGEAGDAFKRDSFQGDLHLQFEPVRWTRSTTLLGYEWWRNETPSWANNLQLAPEFQRINLAALPRDKHYWDQQVARVVFNDLDQNRAHNFSYYAQQEIEFWNRRIIAMAGWRHDAQDSRNIDDNGTITLTDDETDSYRYGLTTFLNPRRTLAVYGVMSDSQDPSQQRNVYGAGLAVGDPRVDERLTWNTGIELKEFGLKAELFNRRLSLTAARFEQSLVNSLNTIGSTPVESPPGSGRIVFVNVASLADATVKGWEFEAVGDFTERFSVVSNLAFMRSNELRALGNQLVQQKVHRVPEWNFNVFAKYDFRARDGNGWTVRAGVHSYGDFIGTFVGMRVPMEEAFVRYDAGVRYHWRNLAFDLFVKNITDEALFVMRAEGPRSYRFSVNANW
jgi:iron complex outermembrane recepter protein